MPQSSPLAEVAASNQRQAPPYHRTRTRFQPVLGSVKRLASVGEGKGVAAMLKR